MKRFLLVICVALSLFASAQKENYLLVGTYTSKDKSQGIYVYKFNSETGDAQQVAVGIAGNPSYLAISPNEKFVYSVHENGNAGKGGSISAFSFDKKTGKLTEINSEPTGGDHPCYVAIDKTGKWVFAGNYTSGSLSVYPVYATGGLGAPATIQHPAGSGVVKDRQAGPHVHCTVISADNKWLFVPDLGMDKVMIYAFDEKTGKLTPGKQPFEASEPGGGPRHFTFHPNGKYAYLVEELSGQVAAYKYNNGTLTFVQRISTVPAGQTGYPGSADIHISPDGKFLYASNRGDFNTIASYKIDQATGKLTAVENISTLGKAPRNFNFDPTGNLLLVGNQDSNEIVIFKRDKQTGKLTDSGKRIQVGKPVCIKWAKLQ